ncbi:MAG TPA: hypothetical protein VEH62_04730 [Gemmatimonadales bacterium]|nr:hypothetical protein [Gemmatimonadales bacterium]
MHTRLLGTAAVLGAVALGFACGNPTHTNGCGTGTPADLSGSYVLASYTLGTKHWTAPPSSGGLQLSSFTYSYTITLSNTPSPPTVVRDSGTYEFVGLTCIIQTSLLDTTHFAGSFAVTTTGGITQLGETGSDGTNPVGFVWTKQ